MNGNADQLTGHAIKLQTISSLDHTYVTSSCGHTWGCFGRSTGGVAICLGSGDSALAACLARADGRAGIAYGITGLCHQTSNRILFPANIKVDQANGYALSSMIFGDFGRGVWAELNECLRFVLGKTSEQDEVDMEQRRFSTMGDSPLVYGDDVEARKQFFDLLRKRLPDASIPQIEAVLSVQGDIRDKQARAAQELLRGTINSTEYLKLLQEFLKEAVERSREIIDEDQIRRLFEEAAQNPEQLLDDETFFRSRS